MMTYPVNKHLGNTELQKLSLSSWHFWLFRLRIDKWWNLLLAWYFKCSHYKDDVNEKLTPFNCRYVMSTLNQSSRHLTDGGKGHPQHQRKHQADLLQPFALCILFLNMGFLSVEISPHLCLMHSLYMSSLHPTSTQTLRHLQNTTFQPSIGK